MSDNDLIRRGQVLERLELAEHDAEERDWRSGANEISRLRKYVAAIPAVQPTVKPLVWAGSESELISRSMLGSFSISAWHGKVRAHGPSKYYGEYPTIEAAKAAAQADYEARILSALDMQQTVSPDVVALVEAAEAQLQYMDMCNDKGDLERNLRAALARVKGETK